MIVFERSAQFGDAIRVVGRVEEDRSSEFLVTVTFYHSGKSFTTTAVTESLARALDFLTNGFFEAPKATKQIISMLPYPEKSDFIAWLVSE